MGNFCGTRPAAIEKVQGLCETCEANYEQYTKSGKRKVQSPVLRAAERSHVYCVKALIESGADLNNCHVATLVQAVRDGDDECVNFSNLFLDKDCHLFVIVQRLE